MNPQELYEAYMSVYESDDRREMRRLASQERQAEKKAESEFRNKAGVGAKKSGPKMSTTKLSKKEGEGYAKQTMKDAEHIAKKAKGHTVGNPFPEQVDHFDEVLSEITAAGYSVEQALAYMVYEAQYARNNPEKYEREQEKKQSARERRMNDPKTGINSKAFNDFYNAQMGRKKKVSEATYGAGDTSTPADKRMVVTNADKKANTPAYQRLMQGNPAYVAAPHLKGV